MELENIIPIIINSIFLVTGQHSRRFSLNARNIPVDSVILNSITGRAIPRTVCEPFYC